MFKKNKILLSLIPFISFGAFASEELEFGFYGNLHYDFSDYEVEGVETDLDTETRFAGTNIGVYSNFEINDKASMSLDAGVTNDTDFIYGRVIPDEFNFVLNKAFITYNYNSNLDVEIGRMFTPIGLFHDDPTHKDNIIDNTNPVSRYSDAINVRFQHEKEGINFDINAFVATHLDESQADSHYGANVLIGNDKIGQFSLGYASYDVDRFTEEMAYLEGGYYFNRNNISFVVNGKHLKDGNDEEYNIFVTKGQYDFNGIKPYIRYRLQETDNSILDSYDMYGTGVEFDVHKTLSLSVGYDKFEYKDFDGDYNDDVFRAGLSFRI